MFETISLRLKRDLAEVKRVAQWHDDLRTLLTGNSLPSGRRLDDASKALLDQLAPGTNGWRLFDHCAAVSRIYAILERAICDLVTEYLQQMPNLFSQYGDLPEEIRNQHRIGTAHVLSKWGPEKSLYSNIPENMLSAGLADGLRGKSFSLLAEAFLTDSDNFRSDTVNRVFSKVGFKNVFAAVKKNDDLVEFLSSKSIDRGADEFLNDFVTLRNEAAHGDITDVASAKELINYSNFIELIYLSIARIVISRSIHLGIAADRHQQTGSVIKRFSNNIVGVRGLVEHRISKGDVLYAGSKYFDRIKVIEVAVHGQIYDTLEVKENFEFSLKLDRRLAEDIDIIRLNYHDDLLSMQSCQTDG